MKRRFTLAQHVFEIRTADWPFADDERLCLDLAERELKSLAREDRERAARLAADLEAGQATDVVADILARAWRTAAPDYEFGVNEFECVLEVRPALARVVRA
ncbi:MAG: hypothetical protein JWN80_2606 [Microbacteriaceae bacterium]|jgi:hypothetical protein|nr:hypothetical protein [Microbacteriaceae bacterium]